jgi:hypothetical protein
MGRLRASWIAAGCLVMLLLTAPRSHACSCRSLSYLLSTAGGASQALDLPLVYAANFATPVLTDASGQPLELAAFRTLASLGLCGAPFQFLRPSPALSSGVEYTLMPASPLPDDDAWVNEHTVTFRAGGSSHGLSLVLELEARLEAVEPYRSSEAACGDPRLNDHLISRTTTVSFSASEPALLFLQVTAQDPLLGAITDTATSFRNDSLGTTAAVTLPVPEEGPGCVSVALIDALGADVWQRELCPTLEAPELVTASATVPSLGPRADASEPTGGDHAGCACSSGRAPSPSGTPWLLLMGAACLRRRLGRSGSTSAPSETARFR